SDAAKLRRRTRGAASHWACTSAGDGRTAWMVHSPDSRTHSVSAVGRVTSSVPWGCVSGVVASMQCAAPRLLDTAGCRHRWYTKPSWDTRKAPGSSIDRLSSSIVLLAYSIPYGEEVVLCLYIRIALSIARLLIVRK